MKMTEQLAERIASEFMNKMNPDRWNGFGDMPNTLDTTTYEDSNIIDIKDVEHHIEIVITVPQASGNKPVLYVDLVADSETVAMCHTHTLSSSHIVQLMIQHVCKEVTTKAA